MKRLALFGASLLALSCSGAEGPPAPPPNFVLVLADDLGYGDLGVYGNREIETPRIDGLAREGMRFTSFYAQPLCGPARAALMTGSHPMRVAEAGPGNQVHPVLHDREITIAEILKDRGYATACFGKWDLAGHSNDEFTPELLPEHQGFDEHFGTPTSNDSRKETPLLRNGQVVEKPAQQETLTRRYTDEAIRFMSEHAGEPFFVYLPYNMPHAPVSASSEFQGRSKRGPYGDTVQELDWNVGRLIDAVRELGVADHTYLLFTSDNGPWRIKRRLGGSARPLRGGKLSTWEGGVRVPFVVWGPGRIPPGTTHGGLASVMDVLPTLAALAGAPLPADRVLDGEDLSAIWFGKSKGDPERETAYYLWNHLQAVRSGRWKLHLPRPARPPWLGALVEINHVRAEDYLTVLHPMLYDLEADPGERINVAADHPKVVARLLEQAERTREDLGDYDRAGAGRREF